MQNSIRLYLLLWVITLMGCSDTPSPVDQMQNYANRIADILDQPIVRLNPKPLPPIPPHRQRVYELMPLREGLIDVLAFRHCGMLELIAQRNSSLGKVAPPSQILNHELRFLSALERCLNNAVTQQKLDHETKVHFREIARIKRQQLPAVLWNAFYTGQEIEKHLTLSAPLLNNAQEGLHVPALTTWETFATISTQANRPLLTFEFNLLEGLEAHFATLYHSTSGASILKSLQLLTATLNQVATIIDERLQRRPLCFNGQPTNKSRILRSTFNALYAKKLQPYMAYTHRLGQRWFNVHSQLLRVLTVPKTSASYSDQVFSKSSDKSIWKAYQQALKHHTQAWQTILGQCGLMPTAHESIDLR